MQLGDQSLPSYNCLSQILLCRINLSARFRNQLHSRVYSSPYGCCLFALTLARVAKFQCAATISVDATKALRVARPVPLCD